jgi:hypothetical protein
MDPRYADAMVALEDAVSDACYRAERMGLTNEEIAGELRRIADQLDTDEGKKSAKPR